MITIKMNIKRVVTVAMLFAIHSLLFTASAQVIKTGTHWWDGKRLYTASVDETGKVVTMKGVSEDMGGDTFLLNLVRNGRYTIAADNKYGWLSIRGQVGWRVDYVQDGRLNLLVVRNPYDDCIYTFTLTSDDLGTCLAQQRQDEQREVSWMLQNRVLDVHYLGQFSKPQLRLLRNEILARHGWRFQSKDLQEHFGQQAWYSPVADNKSVTLSLTETINLQLLKTEEAVDDGNRVRYERTEGAPAMLESVDGVVTVSTEEQLLGALGNNRTVEIGEDVHLNLSRILEQEDKFSGIAGRSWVTIAKRGGQEPTIVSDYCGDGQQLTLKNFRKLTIRGKRNSSIEVDPRYAYCLNFMDCSECRVENLTIGHTEGGYCDGGVIGFTGGTANTIADCDLYGCGTYGLVTHETQHLSILRTNVHDCTYGIMELYDSDDISFEDCDFFNNREYELISSNSSNVVFRGCRFFANWAEAPLFQCSEDVTLYRCELRHPNIGSRKRLLTPDNDCIFGDDALFEPEARQKPIGPDVVTATAQPKYERKDFTFKVVKVKNAEGLFSEVCFRLFVGSKLIKEYTFELSAPLSEDMANNIGTYSEEDLNFDGYPDVDVYLGYYGGFANNTQHEALLWDQEQHQFVYPEGFAGIGEPMLDAEKMLICTTSSAGPDHRVTSYYRWHGHKLEHYLDNVWPIEGDDDDYFVSDDMLNYPLQRYDGKLDGRIPVIIAFQKNEDNTVAGYIYYPNAKNPAPIMIVGVATRYDGKDIYSLSEFQPDGKVSGVITIEHQADDDWSDKVEGTWTDPKTEKQMELTDVWFKRECPKWFTKSLLTPEDPGNIGREYSFQQWRQGYDEYTGGHVTFRAAGKNKIHFECCNVVRNIAEGKSEEDRPAELQGNRFEYRDVNECGYGFQATFYPQFVVLKSITEGETLGCFGAFSAFDGTYIKVKQ